MKRCRICGRELFDKPILQFKNMPRNAQYLPSKITKERGINLKIYECSGCGLIQLKIKPVSYYKESIRAISFSEEMRTFRLNQLGNFIKEYDLFGKRGIEIGSGKGEYLSLLKELGLDMYGLEYFSDSVNRCKKKGLKVIEGFVEKEDYVIPNGPFDAFFIFSFLEHLPDPNTVLRCIYRNLKEDGVGIVEVPNFDMILKKGLFSEFMADHLSYFTKKTLRIALELNGFDVIKIDEIWHEYILSAIVRKRRRVDVSGFLKTKEKIEKQLKDYLRQFRRVAVWGAGHQAFAILSLTGIAKRISYVVDSADFKQGKFTPLTHIPIHSPEYLRKDPVDAVIVMAGSYSDEIKEILLSDYDKRMRIAILRESGLEIVR